MAAANKLVADLTPGATGQWQLAKTLSVAQTAITAAKLSQGLWEASYDEAIDVLDVSTFGALRVQFWGEASDNNTPVINVYGWMDGGPGEHVGTVTTSMGNFTSAATTGFHASKNAHKSIRDEFVGSTAYRGCDTLTITNDYQAEYVVEDPGGTPLQHLAYKSLSVGGITYNGAAAAEADFPASLIVNLNRNQYKWIAFLVTALNSATNVAAIFRPLAIHGGYHNLHIG